MKDLFEDYEALPNEVKSVIDQFIASDETYENCNTLVVELNELGYTCDYGLDAVPYDLRKL